MNKRQKIGKQKIIFLIVILLLIAYLLGKIREGNIEQTAEIPIVELQEKEQSKGQGQTEATTDINTSYKNYQNREWRSKKQFTEVLLMIPMILLVSLFLSLSIGWVKWQKDAAIDIAVEQTPMEERSQEYSAAAEKYQEQVIVEEKEKSKGNFFSGRRICGEKSGVDTKLYRFPGGSINGYNKRVREEIIREMTERGYIYYDWNASLEDATKNPKKDQL